MNSASRGPLGIPIVMEVEVPVLACVPVDTTQLAEAFPDVVHLIPKPSINHSVVNCASCNVQVWIGPSQLRVAREAHGASILCYMCIARARLLDLPVRSLDPHADDVPRHT